MLPRRSRPNAGAAIFIAGKAESIHEGVKAAETALEQGKGIQSLEYWRCDPGGRQRDEQISAVVTTAQRVNGPIKGEAVF